MLATRDRSEEFDFDFVLYVILTEVRRTHLHLIPLKAASVRSLNLRLIDWGKLSIGNEPLDHKEAKFCLIRYCGNRVELYELAV